MSILGKSVDTADKSFLSCLKEIELGYVNMARSQRLLVERWVEKIVLTTDSNPVWKKHRNCYAKLLLSNVISKSLTDPFNHPPPDGPLPSFPTHYRHKFKGMLGVHESSFWRDLYQRVQDLTDSSLPPRPTQSLDLSSNHKEVHNLKLIVQEQTERIMLLEQQLHDERVQYELQIQRLHYSHRIELGRMKNMRTGANLELTANSVSQSPKRSIRVDSSLNLTRGEPPMAASMASKSLDESAGAAASDARTGVETIRRPAPLPPPPVLTADQYMRRSLNPFQMQHNPTILPPRASQQGAPSTLPFDESNSSKVITGLESSKEDDDYLRYIEKFQAEVQRLQAGPVGSSEFRGQSSHGRSSKF